MERPRGEILMTSAKRRERRARLLGAGALVLSLLIFVPAAARAEGPPTLTLQQALRQALEANASTATGRSMIAVSEAQVRQLRSSILPHLDLDTSATRNSNQVAFDVNGFQALILPRNDWSARINLSQPIYAGRRETMALRQGRLGVSSGEAALRSTEDMVLLATASDYLGIVQGEALVSVEQKNLELADRRRKQAQAFFDAGEQTRVDVLRAETDQKASERALAAALQSRDLSASRLRLDLALDEPAGASLRVAAPELKFPPLPGAEALVAQAEASHPAIQRADLALQIATLETAMQRAARLPTVKAEGDVLRQRTSFPTNETAALTIRLTMPIFDSGEISAKVAVAREQQRQAEIALAEAKRQVREDVLQALLNLETTEKDLALAREQLTAAEAEYSQSFELYRAEEATSLDVQTSEAALASSRRAVANGTVNRDLAELNVWSAAGTLKKLILTEEGGK
jgi:outer membrane protein